MKQSGIVKERVFGCDLGEHLLNSGHDGNYSGVGPWLSVHVIRNPLFQCVHYDQQIPALESNLVALYYNKLIKFGQIYEYLELDQDKNMLLKHDIFAVP